MYSPAQIMGNRGIANAVNISSREMKGLGDGVTDWDRQFTNAVNSFDMRTVLIFNLQRKVDEKNANRLREAIEKNLDDDWIVSCNCNDKHVQHIAAEKEGNWGVTVEDAEVIERVINKEITNLR